VKILAKENQATTAMIESANILGIAAGCLEALALLTATRRVLWDQPDSRPVPLSTLGFQRIGMSIPAEDVLKSLNTNFEQIAEIAGQALKGQRPELKYWKAEIEIMEQGRAKYLLSGLARVAK
jgi:hypothetical protein